MGTLSAQIGTHEGQYYGECVEIDNFMIPSGRGALFVHDYENGLGKWILGYIEKE